MRDSASRFDATKVVVMASLPGTASKSTSASYRMGDHRTSTAYLFVDDADRVAADWKSAGAEVHPPEDTEWGQHEGALVDPDGNVIRFGSPIR